MRSILLSAAVPMLGAMLLGSAGCTENISPQQLAQKMDEPSDTHFFGDHAVYMGDKDGYRYVHVRDLFDTWTCLGECTYKVAESDWPMEHPMPLTDDADQWQDVEWLNGDRPPGVPQNVNLYVTPSFPMGAPRTQPSMIPPQMPQ